MTMNSEQLQRMTMAKAIASFDERSPGFLCSRVNLTLSEYRTVVPPLPGALPSAMSFYVGAERQLLDSDEWAQVGAGTGFIVAHGGHGYLVTNWHVVTRRNPVTDKVIDGSAAKPTRLRLVLPVPGSDGLLVHRTVMIPLYGEDGRSHWLVHPDLGREVDIVAVRLNPLGWPSVIRFLAYSVIEPSDPALLRPTSEVSIVGFPFDLDKRIEYPIWTRAAIATEPEMDFEGTPCFLVDAKARGGQSGSPVIGYWTMDRMKVTRNNSIQIAVGESFELLGIYSGRISDGSDLGRVWKRGAIREVLEGGVFDDYMFD